MCDMAGSDISDKSSNKNAGFCKMLCVSCTHNKGNSLMDESTSTGKCIVCNDCEKEKQEVIWHISCKMEILFWYLHNAKTWENKTLSEFSHFTIVVVTKTFVMTLNLLTCMLESKVKLQAALSKANRKVLMNQQQCQKEQISIKTTDFVSSGKGKSSSSN